VAAEALRGDLVRHTGHVCEYALFRLLVFQALCHPVAPRRRGRSRAGCTLAYLCSFRALAGLVAAPALPGAGMIDSSRRFA